MCSSVHLNDTLSVSEPLAIRASFRNEPLRDDVYLSVRDKPLVSGLQHRQAPTHEMNLEFPQHQRSPMTPDARPATSEAKEIPLLVSRSLSVLCEGHDLRPANTDLFATGTGAAPSELIRDPENL